MIKTFRLRVLVVAFIGALLLLPGIMVGAYASPLGPADDSRGDYAQGMGRKLGRGVANAGLGWVEVFKGVQDVSNENGFWAGATWGPIYGTVNAVRRTAAGVYETATFPFQGPKRFEPIVEPEFVLQEN